MIKDTEKIEKRITELEMQMDSVMQISRGIVRLAGKSMTAMHAKDMDGAEEMLGKMETQLKELKAKEKGFEHYSLIAHQEYTEAIILYNILKDGSIPSFSQIGETEVAYLLGMMDVVGELKREAFEAMRNRKLKDASAYYDIMLDIYDSTAHFRFASALVPDFRRKQDVARIQLESTINELVSLESKAGKRDGNV